MRNLLARAPKSAQAMAATTVRTVCDQPDRAAAEAQLLQVVEALPENRACGSHQARASA
jgi:transposase-like protein